MNLFRSPPVNLELEEEHPPPPIPAILHRYNIAHSSWALQYDCSSLKNVQFLTCVFHVKKLYLCSLLFHMQTLEDYSQKDLNPGHGP